MEFGFASFRNVVANFPNTVTVNGCGVSLPIERTLNFDGINAAAAFAANGAKHFPCKTLPPPWARASAFRQRIHTVNSVKRGPGRHRGPGRLSRPPLAANALRLGPTTRPRAAPRRRRRRLRATRRPSLWRRATEGETAHAPLKSRSLASFQHFPTVS